VHEAVLEDGLGDRDASRRRCSSRHELRLHVGGELPGYSLVRRLTAFGRCVGASMRIQSSPHSICAPASRSLSISVAPGGRRARR
jgi:hypothetical protein